MAGAHPLELNRFVWVAQFKVLEDKFSRSLDAFDKEAGDGSLIGINKAPAAESAARRTSLS